MKIFNPLSILLAVVLAFTMVSCTTSQYASDEGYERDRQVGNRIYIDDPYRGTVVLERDPYTGRYYDVTNGYGYNYGSAYDRYGYNNPYRNNRSYRTYDRTTTTQPAQQTRDNNNDKARQEARKKVLGQ